MYNIQQHNVKQFLSIILSIMLHGIMFEVNAETAHDTATTEIINLHLSNDSIRLIPYKNNYSLLDSIGNDSILKSIFHPYIRVYPYGVKPKPIRSGIASSKEIQYRPPKRSIWRFWIIIFILLYLSFLRISNPSDFWTMLQSVFNQRLTKKIWDEQSSNYMTLAIHMFVISILITALFINTYFEQLATHYFEYYILQYTVIVLIFFFIFICKFSIHYLLGLLLKIKLLSKGFFFNTITVNSFVTIFLFPVIIFYTYNTDTLWSAIVTQSVVGIYFISLAYRNIRLLLLNQAFFTLPVYYLFIYLCALEIVPILIIVKYLNTHNL